MTGMFLRILGMSLTASIVIGAVILLRLALKRAPKVFSYMLWFAVIFRLLCPASFELPVGIVMPVSVDILPESSLNKDMMPKPAPEPIALPESAEEYFVDTSEGYYPRDDRSGYTGYYEAAPAVTGAEISPYESNASASADETGTAAKITPLFCISAAWLAGVFIMALSGIISCICLSVRLKGARRIKDTDDDIFISETVDNAFIMGIFFPKIYLPAAAEQKNRELIILHERTHIRRCDHIAKLVMYATLCLHWFNPLVWLSFRLFERDMEMSCDEAVTGRMSREEKADYSQALLSVSARKAVYFTACFGENGAKSRIKNVLSFKKPAFWVMVLCGAAVIAAAAMLMVNRRPDNIPQGYETNVLADREDESGNIFQKMFSPDNTEYYSSYFFEKYAPDDTYECELETNNITLPDRSAGLLIKALTDLNTAPVNNGMGGGGKIDFEISCKADDHDKIMLLHSTEYEPIRYFIGVVINAKHDHIESPANFFYEITESDHERLLSLCDEVIEQNSAPISVLDMIVSSKYDEAALTYNGNTRYLSYDDTNALLDLLRQYSYEESDEPVSRAGLEYKDMRYIQFYPNGHLAGYNSAALSVCHAMSVIGTEYYIIDIANLNSYHDHIITKEQYNEIVKCFDGYFGAPPKIIALYYPSVQWKNSVYYASEFPFIYYADNDICVFSEGSGRGIFMYSFKEERLIFETNTDERPGSNTTLIFQGVSLRSGEPELYFRLGLDADGPVYRTNIEKMQLEYVPDEDISKMEKSHSVHIPDSVLEAVRINESGSEYVYWELSDSDPEMSWTLYSTTLVKHTAEGDERYVPFKKHYISENIYFAFAYSQGEFSLYQPLSSSYNDRLTGKYTREDNVLICTAETGDIFRFEEKEDTLRYTEQGSAQGIYTIEDGLSFKQAG